MKEQKDLVVKQDSSIEKLLSQAIDKGVTVETMEKLLVMRTQLKQEFAKEEFNRAMSEFQAECPTIEKTKSGAMTGGKAAYKYAPLESIVEQVKDLIKKHGFSYGMQTIMTDTKVKVICTVRHNAGHSESTDIELPLTTRTGVMSAPQVVAATVTFGKRYSFCNGFGIMTGDEDTCAQEDIQEVVPQKVSIPQQETAKEPPKHKDIIISVCNVLELPDNSSFGCLRGKIDKTYSGKVKNQEIIDYLVSDLEYGNKTIVVRMIGSKKHDIGKVVDFRNVKIVNDKGLRKLSAEFIEEVIELEQASNMPVKTEEIPF